MPSIVDRIKHGWNAFMGRDAPQNYGVGYSRNPYRYKVTPGNERSIIIAILTRISIDCAAIKIEHAKTDDEGNFLEVVKSGLNRCLTVEANKDQTGRAFMQDVVMSLCDEGVVAIVPIDTSISPINNETYDINSMRTGKVVQWFPDYVQVDIYNDRTGLHERRTLPKKMVAIVENPLYSIMNEPNSTLRRLIRKLNILDAVDEQSGAGKLDLIIQVPYSIKSPALKKQAESRRKAVEDQLNNSKYGIAYADGTEKVIQLNRAIENNLLQTIEYLTTMLYGQLGITENVLNGTANEQEMLNYYSRTIEPILAAITSEMRRKFLTKTAITQGKTIYFFREPFKVVPIMQLADMFEKLIRNEVLTSNEARARIGMKPVDTERANALLNPQLYNEGEGMTPQEDQMQYYEEEPEYEGEEDYSNITDEDIDNMDYDQLMKFMNSFKN